jgi:hypothetical protein
VPSSWTEPLGQTKALQFLHAADRGGASVSVCLDVGTRPKIYDAIMLRSLARKRTIEPGPPIGVDLSIQIATDLEIASRPKFERTQMRRSGAQSVADILAGNEEVVALPRTMTWMCGLSVFQ